MTEQQFNALAELLSLSDFERHSAYDAVFADAQPNADALKIVQTIHAADALIRSAYVVHGPMEFRVEVSHRDVHRRPGSSRLAIGDIVRLSSRSTERRLTVRVTAQPSKPTGYYRGVVTERPSPRSRYAVGDGVEFSEDQVVMDADDAPDIQST